MAECRPVDAIRGHLHRLIKHLKWISLAVAGAMLCRHFLPLDMLRAANELGGSFLQTFGGMYGVIVAFAIYVTWGQLNETQVAIEREAVALLELYRILGWFTTWLERDTVRMRLIEYAVAVPRSHSSTVSSEKFDEHRVIDASMAKFLNHAPGSASEERLHSRALDLFHELNECREHRVTVSSLKLPLGMRWFVFIGGAITVGSMLFVWVDSAVIHGLFTAGMTWVVVAAASIVVDLDDPYTGDFIVNWKRFNETARLMELVHCPHMPK